MVVVFQDLFTGAFFSATLVTVIIILLCPSFALRFRDLLRALVRGLLKARYRNPNQLLDATCSQVVVYFANYLRIWQIKHLPPLVSVSWEDRRREPGNSTGRPCTCRSFNLSDL